MGTEPLPLKGHRILNQGSSRGLSFPKYKKKIALGYRTGTEPGLL